MFVVCGQEYQKSLKSPFQLYEPTSLVYPGVNHPGKLKEKKRFSRNIYISINFFFLSRTYFVERSTQSIEELARQLDQLD